MPSFADFTLWLWGPLTLIAFAVRRPQTAVLFSVLGAAMFLPERARLDFPLLPSMSKENIPTFACLLGMLVWMRPRLIEARPVRGLDLLVLALLAGNVGTVLTNGDYIAALGKGGTALTYFDIASMALRDILAVGVPFLVGRAAFRTAGDLHQLMRVFVLCGLGYSLLALFELRFSPQLHHWIYGYYQHSFVQQIRPDGSYRPLLFMTHGLNVSRFFLVCLLCAAALARIRGRLIGVPARAWTVYLFIILVFTKSVGTSLYGFVLAPVVLWGSTRAQLRAAALLAAVVVVYPVLRTADVFPADELVELAREYSGPSRAKSLEVRFEAEERLRDHMLARPLFGWGDYDRARVMNPMTRKEITVDGQWVQVMGGRGVVGFLCLFGLYLIPVWQAFRRRDEIPPREMALIAGLAMIAAILTADNIPNSPGSFPQFFLAGALGGLSTGIAERTRLRRLKARRERLKSQPPPPAPERRMLQR